MDVAIGVLICLNYVGGVFAVAYVCMLMFAKAKRERDELKNL